MGPFTITNSDVDATTSTNTYTSTSTIDQTWQAGKMMGGNGNMACGDTREVKAPSSDRYHHPCPSL